MAFRSFFPSWSPRLRPALLLLALALSLGGCATWDSVTRTLGVAQSPATPAAAPRPAPPPAVPLPPLVPAPPLPYTAATPPTPLPVAAPPAPVLPGKRKVAILLPLSGKNAPLGQALLNAAQMATFDHGGARFELMPRDTGATPDNAAAAARDALASGAELLIGPVFAADVAAVKPVARAGGVNLLALSTDVSLGEPGAWVMGFTPTPQVERIVAWARAQGLARFAAVLPDTPYGDLVKDAFQSAVRRQGGALVALVSQGQVAQLIPLRERIEALLLPLAGTELRQTLGQLAAAGLTRSGVRLLGTSLWDEPGLGRGQETLLGAVYAGADPAAREAFVGAYTATWGQAPPRLATLGYDATALAAILAARGAPFNATSMTNPNGFTGLDGLFRLTPGGHVERGLGVNEVTDSMPRVVDPPPAAFAGFTGGTQRGF